MAEVPYTYNLLECITVKYSKLIIQCYFRSISLIKLNMSYEKMNETLCHVTCMQFENTEKNSQILLGPLETSHLQDILQQESQVFVHSQMGQSGWSHGLHLHSNRKVSNINNEFIYKFNINKKLIQLFIKKDIKKGIFLQKCKEKQSNT